MTVIWKHLRPIDRYTVQFPIPPSVYDVKTIAQLYQPIIGSLSYALYMTLLSETEEDTLHSTECQHQWLMKAMSVPLDQIYRARLRLEAVGLLKTYRQQNNEGETSFTYTLQCPLTPGQFFQDDILSICLYNQVGTTRFKQLRARYSNQYDHQLTSVEGEEITKEFHEVFQSLHPTEFMAKEGTEMQRELQLAKEQYPLPDQVDNHSHHPKFDQYELDLEALKGFLMKGTDTKELFKPAHLDVLKRISFFYQMDIHRLSLLIEDSLTVDDQLDVEKLKENAKRWYRFQHGGGPPQTVHVVQPPQERDIDPDRIQSEEERHFHKLETMSPLQLLESYQGGGKVAEADVKLLQELLFDYELKPSVVNMLIEYILFTNDFKLPRNLVTKVAAHWKRQRIETVRQADQLARKEHEQYKNWKSKQGQSKEGEDRSAAGANKSRKKSRQSSAQRRTAGSYPKQVRKDRLPKWVEEQEKSAAPSTQGDSAYISDEEKRRRMRALMENLGEEV